MKRIKLLHFADLHLDAPFTSLGDAAVAETRRHELKSAFRKIIDTARAEEVDLLLAAGDLFEHGYAGKSAITLLQDGFESLGDTPVAIVPGNHDPYVPGSWYRSAGWPANVHILKDDGKLELGPRGAVVYGGLPGTAMDENLINILLLHGTLDLNPGGRAYNPVASRDLDAPGIDYAALGHFHSPICGAGSRGRIFNPGSPEPLGFDEEGSHGIFLSTVEKENGTSRVEARFLTVNRRSYINLSVRLEECATDERAAETALKALEAGSADDLYGITFTGATAAGFRLNRNRTAVLLRERVYYAKIKDETVPAYDLAEIRKEPGLRGLFAGRMLDRASKTAGGEERELIMQALYFGLEAIDRGEIST